MKKWYPSSSHSFICKLLYSLLHFFYCCYLLGPNLRFIQYTDFVFLWVTIVFFFKIFNWLVFKIMFFQNCYFLLFWWRKLKIFLLLSFFHIVRNLYFLSMHYFICWVPFSCCLFSSYVSWYFMKKSPIGVFPHNSTGFGSLEEGRKEASQGGSSLRLYKAKP